MENARPTWPQLPSGSIDWDRVFDDPAVGLIVLIRSARTARALRDSTIVVIKMLYTRDDDPPEVERLTAEITRMISDDASEAVLAKAGEAVTAVLGQIKNHRKQQVVEYEAKKKEKVDAERRAATLSPRPEISSATLSPRPEPPKSPLAHKPAFLDDDDEEETKKPVLIGLGAAAALAAIAAGAYFLAFRPGVPEKKTPNLVLIDQMKEAAQSKTPATHVFGGPLKITTLAGRTAIIAEGIPEDACSSAAWVFVNRGNVMINGFMPTKISPSIIAKLCGDNPQSATLTWLPK